MTDITDLDSLERALWQSYHLPKGTVQAAAVEAIVEKAAAIGPQAHVKALVRLMNAYYYTDDADRMLVPFATALAHFDRDPALFDGYDLHALFWNFKWVANDMLQLPQVPRAAIEDWLDQMGRRYRTAGHTDRAVAMSEHYVAKHVGDTERAQRAFDRWITAERGEMADCHACETANQGDWYVETGQDELALERWQPVLTGEQTCGEEPHRTLASSLLPLVRLGRLDEARRNHLRGYPLVRGSESLGQAVAEHLELCALTGNEARAVEILAENPQYLTTGSPRTRMEWFAVAALLGDRLVALGRGDLPVAGPPGRAWTAAELAVHARAEALALAARFDERNGTSAVGDRVRARMDAEPLLGRFPLGLRAVLPPVAPPASADPATEAGAAEPGALSGEAPAAVGRDDREAPAADDAARAPDAGPPPGVQAALDRFEAAAAADDLPGARDALTEALDLAGDQAGPGWLAATRLNLGEVHAAMGDLGAATHHAWEAVALADLADRRLAAAARFRLGSHLVRAERHDEAAPVLEEALPDLDLDEHGDGVVVQTRWWLGECYRADRPADAARHWLEGARIAETWPEQHDHAMLASMAADALSGAGEPGQALAAYRRAAELWAGLGEHERQVMALRASAWLLRDDDLPAAEDLMVRAAQVAVLAGDTSGAVLGETLSQHARLVAHDDTEDGLFVGLREGAVEAAHGLALRAEAVLRTVRDAGAPPEGPGAGPSDPRTAWARSALLAADLSLTVGEPARALALTNDVEHAFPGQDQPHAWPHGHIAWIRERASR